MDLVISKNDLTNTELYDKRGSVKYVVESMWNWKNPTNTTITKISGRREEEESHIVEVEWNTLQPTLVHIDGEDEHDKGLEISKYLRGRLNEVARRWSASDGKEYRWKGSYLFTTDSPTRRLASLKTGIPGIKKQRLSISEEALPIMDSIVASFIILSIDPLVITPPIAAGA